MGHTEILMLARDDFLRLLKRDPHLVENALFEISIITYMLQQRLEEQGLLCHTPALIEILDPPALVTFLA